ncbi:hypothetical protein Gorai_024718, partial [Gossypium raimondii]|nr:hypothetical protein [Gossypium raimondii]
FLDYDASIPFLSQATHAHSCSSRCNSSVEAQKKIKMGKAVSIYAHFKYEKLSSFCFICGKLGHGENYPFRLRIEPSKTSFG